MAVGPVCEGVQYGEATGDSEVHQLLSLQGMMGSQEAEWELFHDLKAALARDIGGFMCQ